MRMTKRDIKSLSVQERILLFCLASGTDWKEAGVTLKTVASMVGEFFIAHPYQLVTISGGSPALTWAGRAALRELLHDL
jgi:hypothetical protein